MLNSKEIELRVDDRGEINDRNGDSNKRAGETVEKYGKELKEVGKEKQTRNGSILSREQHQDTANISSNEGEKWQQRMSRLSLVSSNRRQKVAVSSAQRVAYNVPLFNQDDQQSVDVYDSDYHRVFNANSPSLLLTPLNYFSCMSPNLGSSSSIKVIRPLQPGQSSPKGSSFQCVRSLKNIEDEKTSPFLRKLVHGDDHQEQCNQQDNNDHEYQFGWKRGHQHRMMGRDELQSPFDRYASKLNTQCLYEVEPLSQRSIRFNREIQQFPFSHNLIGINANKYGIELYQPSVLNPPKETLGSSSPLNLNCRTLRTCKALKSLSLSVLTLVMQDTYPQKIDHKQQLTSKAKLGSRATYKSIADRLVSDLGERQVTSQMSGALGSGSVSQTVIRNKDQLNIKRRVYDALNVLTAAGVLEKKGKIVAIKDRSIIRDIMGRNQQTQDLNDELVPKLGYGSVQQIQVSIIGSHTHPISKIDSLPLLLAQKRNLIATIRSKMTNLAIAKEKLRFLEKVMQRNKEIVNRVEGDCKKEAVGKWASHKIIFGGEGNQLKCEKLTSLKGQLRQINSDSSLQVPRRFHFPLIFCISPNSSIQDLSVSNRQTVNSCQLINTKSTELSLQGQHEKLSIMFSQPDSIDGSSSAVVEVLGDVDMLLRMTGMTL